MDDQLEFKLQQEEAKGRIHDSTWINVIEPFFLEKQRELYQAFVNHPTTDVDGLVNIKMQENVLMSMKDHFQHYINTGNMARKQLKEENDE